MKALLLLAVLASGCAQVQQPYRFSVADPTTAPGTIDKLLRALAESGLTTVSVDRQAGIVHTQWQDTGFMYGQVEGATATIVRRYILTIAAAGTGAQVQLRADTQRCARGNFSIGDAGLQGACQQMEGLVPKHQEDLNALGGVVRNAIGGGV